MTTYEIPVPAVPSRFTIVLAGRDLAMATQYRDTLEGSWLLDIKDNRTGEDLICGIPLIPDVDLLEQYATLLPGQLILRSPTGEPPGFYDLVPGGARLYYVVD
jgi:uncharacterized protein DUF6983